MVIRGGSRGNGRQLAHYLLAKKDNEHIRILDIDGQLNPDDKELHDALFDMSVTAELTKSNKGLYHAQINPDTEASQKMRDKDWLEASDILSKQLGMEDQRRAIVLHTKKGRTHAHVVWERYDHEKGKMVSDSFSRLAQDRARKEMEQVFEHKPTPHRNQHRPELKASLLQLWNQTATGAQFVTACKKNNYLIAEGSGRSPYVVVDENGRSYDLARQLKGVKLKDVRARLRHETLLGEKDAIIVQRNAKNDSDSQTDKGTGKQKKSLTKKSPDMSQEVNDPQSQQQASNLQQQFQQNQTDSLHNGNQPAQAQQRSQQQEKPQQQAKPEQQQNQQKEQEKQPPEQNQKQQFAENKEQATQKNQQQSQPAANRQQQSSETKGVAAGADRYQQRTEQKSGVGENKQQAAGQQQANPQPSQKTTQQFAENKQQTTAAKAQQPQPTPQQQFADNKQQTTGQQPEQPTPQPSQRQEFSDNKHEATGQDNIKDQFAENKEATEKQGQQEDDSEQRREAFRQRAAARKDRKTRGRGPSR